jgi:radical SAM-linked protein
VTVSVSTHVPKPHTPFQWCAMDPLEVVRKKQRWLEEERRAHKGVDLRMHDSAGTWLEGVFARGDRRLGAVLERAYAAGARFDSWEDQLNLPLWQAAFRDEGVDPAHYLGAVPLDARLPWDHIDVGLAPGFLAREHARAMASRPSPPCSKPVGMAAHHTNLADFEADTRKLVCYDCGAGCDLDAMRQRRKQALVSLGAVEPRLAAPSPLEAPAPSHEEQPDPRRAKVPFAQGRGVRYRLGYTKLGPSALLSHLDLLRALPRSFRRASAPLYYSTGFHPKADFSFGPALSLGVSSTCEVADVKLTREVDPAELLEALTHASPEGLRFFAAVRLGPADKAVSRLIDTARYAVAIPPRAVAALGDEAGLAARVAEAMAASDLPVSRAVERVVKHLNVREYLRALRVGTDAAVAAAAEAGFDPEAVVIEVDLEIRGAGAVKIAEVVEVLTGSKETPHQAVRFGMGTWKPEGEVVSPLVGVGDDAGSAPKPG